MRRLISAAGLALALVAASSGAWLLWASKEYRGSHGCVFNTHHGDQPWLVALALSLACTAIMAWAQSRRQPKGASAIMGVATGLLAGVAIGVTALFFGAGLGCTG
jgi:hypothetical protein